MGGSNGKIFGQRSNSVNKFISLILPLLFSWIGKLRKGPGEYSLAFTILINNRQAFRNQRIEVSMGKHFNLYLINHSYWYFIVAQNSQSEAVNNKISVGVGLVFCRFFIVTTLYEAYLK